MVRVKRAPRRAPEKRETTRRAPEDKKRAPDEKKRDATRRNLLDRALALFRKHGVEATTMRDIAKAAGLSLGAAYYYFPSKEALVFAFYEANQLEMETLPQAATGTVRERLGALLHAKLDSIHDQRFMLGTIVQRLIDPGDPLSAFSAQTRAVRDRAIAVFEKPLRDTELPPETIPLVARALWMFQLAVMLLYINDDSPGQKRTHGLVDDALDLIVPMLPMLTTPLGRGMIDRVVGALDRAGVAVT